MVFLWAKINKIQSIHFAYFSLRCSSTSCSLVTPVFAEFVKRSQTVYVIVWKLLFHHSIISISIANIHHFCEKRIVLTLFSEKAHIILYNKKALNSAD